MKESVLTDFGLFLALWRSHLKPSAYQTITVQADGVAFPWWGSNIQVPVKVGDELVVMPTPWGLMVDQVHTKAAQDQQLREAA